MNPARHDFFNGRFHSLNRNRAEGEAMQVADLTNRPTGICLQIGDAFPPLLHRHDVTGPVSFVLSIERVL